MNICYTIFHIDNEKNESRKDNIKFIKKIIKDDIPYFNTNTHKISNRQDLDNYYIDHKMFKIDYKLKFGEIGCIASNYNAWIDFLKTDYDIMIIVEDDAILKNNFVYNLNSFLQEAPSDFDVLSLYVHPGKQFKYESEIHDIGLENICKFYQNQSTLSYAISKNGAKKYVQFVDLGIDNPLDLFIYDENKNVKIYSLKPGSDNLFTTDTLDDNGEVIREFTNIQDTDYA
jgi:GR25 family glycosyltransferase involved in LPS biosynthesis